MLKPENIQRIEFGRQLRDPSESKLTGRKLESWCVCAKHLQQRNCAPNPIKRGEFIFKTRVRIRTVQSADGPQIWYRNQRWRKQCFLRWLDNDSEVWDTLNPLPPKTTKSVEAPRETLQRRLGLDDRQMLMRRVTQQALSNCLRTVRKYSAIPNPTSRTLQALNFQMQRAERLATDMEFWDTKK
jgi:hypothetical protein